MVQETLGGWMRNTYRWVSGSTWAERVAALLGALVLVFSVYTGIIELHRQGLSRQMLAEVKAARLAASSVSADCYATGRRFADQTSPDGFADGVAEEITALGLLQGEITLLQVDKDRYTVRRLLYREDDFYALYDLDEGYTVWRAEARQNHEHTNTGGA